MFQPVRIIDVEITEPLRALDGLAQYGHVLALVRVAGEPVEIVSVPVSHGAVDPATLGRTIAARCSDRIAACVVARALGSADVACGEIDGLLNSAAWTGDRASGAPGPAPLSVTVAVCTRDRPADLERCLQSLIRLTHRPLDLVVIDNAPSSSATREVVARFRCVRYVSEPRPGLNWARNRAALEATGDIVAYTDDDCVVDPDWATALAHAFATGPDVMAVTGLVLPHELETEAQALFEKSGGFGRGFVARWHRIRAGESAARRYWGAGQFGTGANMAFRRRLFDELGAFDPALDVGTVTRGGGDLDMFFRVLDAGHTLLYDPRAIVRHRHRRERDCLRAQLHDNGVGLYAYFVRTAIHNPGARFDVARGGLRWLWRWGARQWLQSFLRPMPLPRDLLAAQLVGALRGLRRYSEAQRDARQIEARFGPQAATRSPGDLAERFRPKPDTMRKSRVAIRMVEATAPLSAIDDLAEYDAVKIIVTCLGHPAGSVDIDTAGSPVSERRLRVAIAEALGTRLMATDPAIPADVAFSRMQVGLARRLAPRKARPSPRLSPETSISIVVATFDRPDSLRTCLRSLRAQKTDRAVQIVVVDNHPASGLTPQVVADFPGVDLVREDRAGLAYARNAGILASRGEIIVTTDDDVVAPAGWLEQLIAPFSQPSVVIVTGNVLPLELETAPQQQFESYGGLSKGFAALTADGDWFRAFRRAVPTWTLGATANAAFRAAIFRDPDIGLLPEALGPGTPTGVGEDTYVFYRALKANGSIAYEPRAYLWHRHRATAEALKKQIYAYSKGHVAYHLHTWLRDGDARGFVQILYDLPRWHARRIYCWARGWNSYPLRLIALEIAGWCAGPFALWRSLRRVRRLGRSADTLPASADDRAARAAYVEIPEGRP
jgi:GT2 family glycosyltransferase